MSLTILGTTPERIAPLRKVVGWNIEPAELCTAICSSRATAASLAVGEPWSSIALTSRSMSVSICCAIASRRWPSGSPRAEARMSPAWRCARLSICSA